MADPSLDEDTREVWCGRCGANLPAESDICPTCGARRRGAPAAANLGVQPDTNEPSHDVDPTLVAGKQERRRLLKHLIAKSEQLDAVTVELTTLKTENEQLKARVASASATAPSKPARSRVARLVAALLGAAAVAAVSIGSFNRFVAVPASERLAIRNAELSARVDEAARTVETLRTDLAAKEQMLNARPPTTPGGPPTADPKAADAALASDRKALADRLAAFETENRRLAQLKHDLDVESQKQADSRKLLDDERGALQRRQAALTQSANAAMPDGVLVWRADVVVPTAVIITGNKANFGSVSGAMPARPAAMKLDVIEGDVKVIEGPGPKNDWNRLYFQVLGKGRVTVFLLWTGRQVAPSGKE